MQRLASARPTATSPPRGDDETTCPVCGDPVRGFESTRPGEHRFVGCGHYASARFLRRHPGERREDAAPGRIGP